MQFKRHELKYFLNDLQSEWLSHVLKQLLKEDGHGTPDKGYLVRSLYFDSFDDECLFQKQSGLLMRKKIRLRTYGVSGSDVVKLEIKYKYGSMVLKESASVSAEDAKELVCGNFKVLLSYHNPIHNKVYGIFVSRAYKPKVVVEYARLAYQMPELGVRVTIDKDLRSDINNLDLFSSLRGCMPVILEGKQILEVKYNDYLPGYLRGFLSGVSSERMAISKYTLARRFSKQHKWEDN